jgi:hypothetical protein
MSRDIEINFTRSKTDLFMFVSEFQGTLRSVIYANIIVNSRIMIIGSTITPVSEERR